MASSHTNLMTEGSIQKKLIAFAIPLFFGNLFQQLYNTADSLIVGQFLGSEALASVSSSGNLIFLMVGFFNGISMGAGVVIARYFGAKDYENMQKAVHTIVAFGIVGGLALTVIGYLLAPQMLIWMGTPADIMEGSVTYFRIYFLGSLAFVLYNCCTGILQSVGDSKHPLYYLIISSITNIVLDILFIAGFGFGVGSAAAATVISQFVSVILCFTRLLRTNEACKVIPRKIRFHAIQFKQIIYNGLPSGCQNSIISFANVIVQSNINTFGSMAVAGQGAYSKIEGFAFLPITCFAMALTTFISQNIGAQQYDRAKKGARFGIFCSIVLAESIGVIIMILAPWFMAFFDSTPEVVAFGAARGRICGLFFCFLALSHCMAGIMRGAGRAIVPMLVMLACWCVVRVLFITITIRMIPDINVINWAYPLTWFLSSVVFLIYYFKVDWVHGKRPKNHTNPQSYVKAKEE